jgi:hypothetical protein
MDSHSRRCNREWRKEWTRLKTVEDSKNYPRDGHAPREPSLTNTIPELGVLQSAVHPDCVTDTSDFHTIIMIPVFDVNGPGIVDPEYFPRTLATKQSIAVQFLTVMKSYPDSVLKEVNTNVTDFAPFGAIIPDMVSLFL